MGWLIAIICAFVTVFPDFCTSLVRMTKTVEQSAQLDAKLGRTADDVCTYLNEALALNDALMSLYAACPAALLSGSVPALQANGAVIEVEQDALLLNANTQAVLLGMDFSKNTYFPRRLAAGPCDLPDLLRCPNEEIFSFNHLSGAEPAGVAGESRLCREVTWRYSDSGVKSL